MSMFAKIFAQIFDSSISREYMVRYVFIDLLVLADRDGVVDMTLDAIARRTNVPEEIVAHAIARLMEQDRKSRSHEEEGRRLIPLDSHRDWGWQIVNYEHYRNIKDEEARRTYFRDKKREQRSKTIKPVRPSPTVSNLVKDIPTVSNNVTQAEADTEAKEQKPSPKPRKRVSEDGMKHSSDPRHVACKEAIFAYYREKNGGVDPDWSGREGRALGMFLNANPKLTEEGIRRLLKHRADSEVNHSERAGIWVGNLKSFLRGPLNQYGKPLTSSNGNGARYAGKQDHLIAILNEPEIEESIERNGAVSGSRPNSGTDFSLR
jgi:hypothetical protein